MNEGKVRHGCISAWLLYAIIVNLGYAIFYSVSIFGTHEGLESLGCGLLSILAIGNILGAILLMRWNKYGFYLYLINSVLATLVNILVMELEPTVWIPGIISVLFWWGVLQIQKDGVSAWKLMCSGWDYQHTRHLYQLFGVIFAILLVLTIVAYPAKQDEIDYDYDDFSSYEDLEQPVDSVAVEDEVEWQTFSDSESYCSIEVPDDFRQSTENADQLLTLMCTDYDPFVIVVTETVKSLNSVGINSIKEYANVVVKMQRNADGASDFYKISECPYGDGSYLVVFELSLDGDKFRYNILTTKTKSNFYYCIVACLEKYAERLQPTMDHILNSFEIYR